MSVHTSARRSALGIIAVALPLLANAAVPQIDTRIDIKGIYIGMPRADLEKQFPELRQITQQGKNEDYTEYLRRTNDAKARQRNFQIAGVSFKQAPSIAYRDKKVDNFVFFFDPKKFETMRDALVEKYPKLGCESSQVKNAMGASFEQIICALQDAESVLKLKRFQDLNTSLLQLTSKKLIEETTEKKNKQKKDI